MAKLLLQESSATQLERKGSKWRAVLVTPGQGSSGFYSPEVLRVYGPTAYAEGMKNWFKHPEWSGDQRDPRDQWGYVSAENVRYEEGVGLIAEINVLPHWSEVVESLAEAKQASLSIYVIGEADEEGNIIRLFPDVQNSVDLVAYPGRAGSGLTEKMYESARAASGKKPAVEASAEEKEGNMDKEIKALLEALITKFDTFVTESKAKADAVAVAEADADAIEKAKTEAVKLAVESYGEKVKAINAAEGLLPSQKASLLVAAENGEDVAPLIESAKSIVDEAKKVLNESRYVSESGSDSDDFTVTNFGRVN